MLSTASLARLKKLRGKNYVQQKKFVLFPAGYSWSEDPRQIMEDLFPLAEARRLIETLANDGPDETETNNIERFKEMLGGKWFNIGNV
jgi:hypothetical protein